MKKQKRNPEKEYNQRSEAVKLFLSFRGQYIVGQALRIAHDQLVKSEPSNALDMRYIGENMFMMGWTAQELMEKVLTNKNQKEKIPT